MTREISYLEDKGVVLVRTTGTYVLESEVDTVREALATMRRHNSRRCLFDHRQTQVVARVMGSYNRPALYKELGFDRFMKIAILLQTLNDDLRFYETVCINRGWKVRIFADYDQAMQWLLT